MLVRADVLRQAGGIDAIRGALIDDCALAKKLKQQGPIWLGLTRRAKSLRPYGGFAAIGRMVSRSAYAELRYSPLLLLGTLIGMVVVYIAPPIITLTPTGAIGLEAGLVAATAWMAMALIYQPILSFYHKSSFWGLALPLIGAIYAWFTLVSAIQHWRGRGGMWKGRAQAWTRA